MLDLFHMQQGLSRGYCMLLSAKTAEGNDVVSFHPNLLIYTVTDFWKRGLQILWRVTIPGKTVEMLTAPIPTN